MTTGYAAGLAGLAEYLGKSPKSTRTLLRRVSIPEIRLPGLKREVVLFKLSDVDEALARFRVGGLPQVTVPGDLDALVAAAVPTPSRTRRATR